MLDLYAHPNTKNGTSVARGEPALSPQPPAGNSPSCVHSLPAHSAKAAVRTDEAHLSF